MNTSAIATEHILEVTRRAEDGDDFSVKTLCVLALFSEGWRPGDPDPTDTPPDGGGELIDFLAYRQARAS